MDGDHAVTVEKILRAHLGAGSVLKLVHQLDYATSGLLCVARSRPAARAAADLFQAGAVEKRYLAVVHGWIDWDGLPLVIDEDNDDDDNEGDDDESSRKQQQKQQQQHPHQQQQQQHHQHPHQQQQQQQHVGVDDSVQKKKKKKRQKRAPGGVQHKNAPCFFEEHKARLRRHLAKGGDGAALTEEESELLRLKWSDVKRDPGRRKRYDDLEEADKAKKRAAAAAAASSGAGSGLPAAFRRARDPRGSFVIDLPVAEVKGEFRMASNASGKPSRTLVTAEAKGMYLGEKVTKVVLSPLTGRRHQLRLHLASIGHPILGDVTYGTAALADFTRLRVPRMMLHAAKLRLPLPGRPMSLASPDPFETLIEPLSLPDEGHVHLKMGESADAPSGVIIAIREAATDEGVKASQQQRHHNEQQQGINTAAANDASSSDPLMLSAAL